jgi:hypothetical protein
MLSAQAMMESFSDAYIAIAFLFVVLFPLAFLISRHMPGKFAAIRS